MYLESQFIPYEQSLALKELGFDEECLDFYDDDKELFYNHENKEKIHIGDSVKAPLYQQAFEFLLNLLPDVSITYFHDGSGSLRRIGNKTPFSDFNNRKECLIELINQAKQK